VDIAANRCLRKRRYATERKDKAMDQATSDAIDKLVMEAPELSPEIRLKISALMSDVPLDSDDILGLDVPRAAPHGVERDANQRPDDRALA
jgi:hypothetical protein